MRDPTGHIVHYNPGEPPGFDSDDPATEYVSLVDAEEAVTTAAAHLSAIQVWEARMAHMGETIAQSRADALKDYAQAVDALLKLLAEQPPSHGLQQWLETTGLALMRLENDMAKQLGNEHGSESGS